MNKTWMRMLFVLGLALGVVACSQSTDSTSAQNKLLEANADTGIKVYQDVGVTDGQGSASKTLIDNNLVGFTTEFNGKITEIHITTNALSYSGTTLYININTSSVSIGNALSQVYDGNPVVGKLMVKPSALLAWNAKTNVRGA